MLTHAEINARFVALDRHQLLMTEAFDGWLAWPIVKERLWLACLQSASGEPLPHSSPLSKLLRLLSGIWQIAAHFVRPSAGVQALLYERREVALPDGRRVHPHLGTRPHDHSLLRCIYGDDGEIRHSRELLDHGLGAVVAILAFGFRRAPSLRAIAKRLGKTVGTACPELPGQALDVMIADQLARFRLRHALFRWLFRRSGVRSVVVVDADSKVAEVAAARSLKLPVIEVQHGMFSAREPDYSWSQEHRLLPLPLPLPQRILVFGFLWRDELVRAGYWRLDEVQQVKSPVVAAYRAARDVRSERNAGEPFRILFASQGYVREAALLFWEAVLNQWQSTGDGQFCLRIKVHPLEASFRNHYETLASRFPQLCTVVPPHVDAFEELLVADLMVGYTSLMMLEATGVGVPVIGLRGGAVADGFAATFGLQHAATGIEECNSPADFLQRVAEWRSALRSGDPCARASLVRSVFAQDGPEVDVVLSAI